MSWIFSKALMDSYANSHCSPEQEAGFSEESSLDGEQFAQLSVMPTPHKFWRNDKTMEFSNLSRFGLTCAVLTEQDGEAVLTSFLGAFPARISVLPEKAQAWKVSAAGYGLSSNESFAKLSQDSCSWKIRQHSLFEDSEQSLQIWPLWGFLQDGESWELPIPEGITIGKEYGYWATPTATDWKGSPKLSTVRKREETHLSGVRLPEHIARQLGIDITNKLNPAWSEQLMTWPEGWTDLKPLGMDKYQLWQQQHSAFFQESNEADS